METANLLKNEGITQRQESPLDVLSRAASMIQKESSGIIVESKLKEGTERERSSDSGFEDGPNSPTKMHSLPVFSSSSKIMVHKEKREKRQQDRKCTTGAPGFFTKESVGKDLTAKHEDDIKRHTGKASPVVCSRNDCRECIDVSQKQSPKQQATDVNYRDAYNRHVQQVRDSPSNRIKVEKEEHLHDKYSAPDKDEREHRIYRYPRIPPPPLISLHPHPFSWLPPPYPSPLSLVRRQSVITSASCPQSYTSSEGGMSLCPCIDPKCGMQAAYPFGSTGSGSGKNLKSPSDIMKREVFTAVPPGFELPTVEEHFRKSLGDGYDDLAVPAESLNSVDEHFAKALGNTWYNIKYKKCVDPTAFRTRDRVLTGCNL